MNADRYVIFDGQERVFNLMLRDVEWFKSVELNVGATCMLLVAHVTTVFGVKESKATDWLTGSFFATKEGVSTIGKFGEAIRAYGKADGEEEKEHALEALKGIFHGAFGNMNEDMFAIRSGGKAITRVGHKFILKLTTGGVQQKAGKMLHRRKK
ncbi:MAG: hypothetical protein LBI34_00845 [Puniceicoccales bacterium]|jgi:hypothetical protein|nr:hypothetical protein [Puniceicoccales bacterium]